MKTILILLVLGIIGALAQQKVQVHNFEMSKCPYCSAYTVLFTSTVMSKAGLPEIIDLKEDFIGSVNGGQFTCTHGPSECVGDEILICASQMYPEGWSWWNLTSCMQSDYTNVPSNFQSCAEKSGYNSTIIAAIQACSQDKTGVQLLTASFNEASNQGIDEAPTIIINGKTYLGGPSSPLKVICDAYTGTKPAACSQIDDDELLN